MERFDSGTDLRKQFGAFGHQTRRRLKNKMLLEDSYGSFPRQGPSRAVVLGNGESASSDGARDALYRQNSHRNTGISSRAPQILLENTR